MAHGSSETVRSCNGSSFPIGILTDIVPLNIEEASSLCNNAHLNTSEKPTSNTITVGISRAYEFCNASVLKLSYAVYTLLTTYNFLKIKNESIFASIAEHSTTTTNSSLNCEFPNQNTALVVSKSTIKKRKSNFDYSPFASWISSAVESTMQEKRRSFSTPDATVLQVLIKVEKIGTDDEEYPSLEKVRERVNYEIYKNKNR